MTNNVSMDAKERATLSSWEYTPSDKFTNMWRFMQDSAPPETTAEGVDRVLAGATWAHGVEEFALVGEAPAVHGVRIPADASVVKYAALRDCDLMAVGDEFASQPYAIAVQQNSPIRDVFSKACVPRLID